MFCKNCGSPIADGIKFCPHCGTAVGGNDSAAAAAGHYPVQNKKRPPYLAAGVLVVLAALAITIVILLVRFIFGGGYKKPIQTLAEGMEQEDGEKVLSAFSKKTVDALEDSSGMDGRDFEREYDSFIAVFTDEDLEGEDFKVECKIEDSEKLNKDDIKDIRDDLKESLGIREDISDAREVDAVFTIYVDDSEEDTIDVSMDVIKVDGKWYISYGSIDVG